MSRRDTTTKRGPGRPTALTPTVADHICRGLEHGYPIRVACGLAGVTATSFFRWIQRAEALDYALATGKPYNRSDEMFREFRDRAQRARASAARTMVDVVFNAAEGGQLIEEEPALDGDGKAILDNAGNPVMKRKWSTPDGRLALQYLAKAQPEDWAGGPQRLELTGPGGLPLNPDGSAEGGEPDGDAINSLARRVAAIQARQAEQTPIPADDTDDEPVEAEIVEDDQ